MDRYVPISKRSKREQKEFYSSQRNTWNGLNPVTRTVPNGKGYNRNKIKAEERRNSRRSNENGSSAVFLLKNISEQTSFTYACPKMASVVAGI